MDSYAGSTSAPLSLHKYLYCHNEPIENVDPTGLKTFLYLIGQDHQGLPFHQAADYLASKLSIDAGDKIVKLDISGLDEFNNALKQNTDIAEIDYIGHGNPGILFVGTGTDPDANITEKGGKHIAFGVQFESKSVHDLFINNVRSDATIHLYSCFSAMSGPESFADSDYPSIQRSFCEHFHVPVYGGLVGTKFKPNGQPYTRFFYKGEFPHNSLGDFSGAFQFGIGF